MQAMWALVACVFSAVADAAPPPEPSSRLMYTTLAVFRYNPLGLQEQATLQWRWRLVDKPGVLWDSTHFSIGPMVRVTPAFVAAGPQLQIQPIALLRLRAAYEGIQYFGSFSQIRSFPTADSEWSDDRLSADGDAGLHYAARGGVLTTEALVQAKVGPIAVRTSLQGYRASLGLDAGDIAYYDQMLDALVPNGGWTIRNEADVLYSSDKLSAGLRWSWTNPVHTGAGVGGVGDENTHRLGPLIAYSFKDEVAGKTFSKPTLLIISQWHLSHPYRAGQTSSQALPLMMIGFAGVGDLKRKE